MAKGGGAGGPGGGTTGKRKTKGEIDTV